MWAFSVCVALDDLVFKRVQLQQLPVLAVLPDHVPEVTTRSAEKEKAGYKKTDPVLQCGERGVWEFLQWERAQERVKTSWNPEP